MEMKWPPRARCNGGSFLHEVGHVRNGPRCRIKNLGLNGKLSRQFAFEADVLAGAERVASKAVPDLPLGNRIATVVSSHKLERPFVVRGDQANTAKTRVVAQSFYCRFQRSRQVLPKLVGYMHLRIAIWAGVLHLSTQYIADLSAEGRALQRRNQVPEAMVAQGKLSASDRARAETTRVVAATP